MRLTALFGSFGNGNKLLPFVYFRKVTQKLLKNYKVIETIE